MKHFIALYIVLFVGCMQILAEDYTVQPVVDISLAGNRWDLTSYEPTGSEIDFHSQTLDGIVSFWSPEKRFDFVNRNDSTLQVCAETRMYRTVFSSGILCEVKTGINASLPFAFKGRIYQSEFVHGNGLSNLAQSIKGRVVTIGGDAEIAATLTQSTTLLRWTLSNDSIVDLSNVADSLICESTVDRYIITAQGRQFPLAFKRVTRTRYMGQEVEADSVAWITTYAPDDARLNNEQRSRRLTDIARQDADSNSQRGLRGDVAVTVDGDELQVTVSMTTDDGVVSGSTGPVRIVITDIVGRQYIDTAASGEGVIRINVGSLNRGEYLLQVISDNGDVVDAVKFMR